MAIESETQIIGPSGKPVPRFMSLKADLVNVRKGPSRDHKIVWVYNRAGQPVEIISEYKQWRKIRDSSGAIGWIYETLLSNRRTALTLTGGLPKNALMTLHIEASSTSQSAAKLGADVIVKVKSCAANWCQIIVRDEIEGWMPQDRLWGVRAGETIQ